MKPLRGRDTNRTSLHFRDLSRQEKRKEEGKKKGGKKRHKGKKKRHKEKKIKKRQLDNFGKSPR